jgi:PAS domain-containing protein
MAERDTPGGPRPMPELARPARVTPIEPGMIGRAARALGSLLGLAGSDTSHARVEPELPLPTRPMQPPLSAPPVVVSAQPEPWMGPGKPLSPVAPPQDVAGRAFDYPVTHNLNTTPRRFEAVSFNDLRNLSYAFDMLRLCIETRKDQLSKLTWSVMPKLEMGQKHRRPADDRCKRVMNFLSRPDGVHDWNQWIRILAEETLVIDAGALYRRRDRAGRPYALEIVDGATILPLIDATGRRPLAPNPAFQQVLKGLPAVNYTVDELTYAVRNPRASKVYGYSPVEQIITNANIGLRRMAGQLFHFTDGNVPDALISVPESWTAQQIQEFQRHFDMMLAGNQQNRSRAKFVPGGTGYIPTRGDGALTDPFDEWLARICCYAFSLPPFPFVRQQNRATAETAYDAAIEEGLAPMLVFIKAILDREIFEFLGERDLEMVWDDVRKLDAVEQQQLDERDVRLGVISIDDMRAKRGQSAVGLPPMIFGLGPLGVIPVTDLKRAFDQGLAMPQAPMPDLMGMGGPGLPGVPPGEDPLADAPPELLAELGIPQGGDEEDDGLEEEQDAPPPGRAGGARSNLLARLASAKGDPRVSSTLRRLERGGMR